MRNHRCPAMRGAQARASIAEGVGKLNDRKVQRRLTLLISAEDNRD